MAGAFRVRLYCWRPDRKETDITIAFNESSVEAVPAGPGVCRQKLLGKEQVPDTNVVFERLTLDAGVTLRFEPAANSLIWFHLVAGEARLDTLYTNRMTEEHSALVPPAFVGALTTVKGATLLYAEVLNVAPPASPTELPRLTVLNWTREPVFVSDRDARKRVALVTDAVCGTKAARIEMVVYPRGTGSASFHQEGAVSFIYVLSGRGSAFANEQSFPVQEGSLVYFPEREPHHISAATDSELRFLSFYVPGAFKTIWANPDKVSGWRLTRLDIHGREPLKDQIASLNSTRGGPGPFF